jgi:thiol-disulfide isomerase/thioredoxin
VDARKTLIIIVVGIVAVAAIWLAAAQPWASDASTPGAGATGDMQLEIAGRTLDGGSFDTADVAGRPVVVNFFASWCAPCNSEAPDLVAFAKAHPEVAFVGVNVGDKQADAEGFVARYGLPYPVVYDGQGTIAQRYGVDGIPVTMFFDKTGKRVATVVGATDRAGFEEKLKAAL